MHRADLIDAALALGFDHAEWIDNQQIVCNRVFREQCEANACGLYGKCWMCPPDAGDIDELIQRVRSYSNGFVYQSIFKIEDSFDFEGMMEGGQGKLAAALQGAQARVDASTNAFNQGLDKATSLAESQNQAEQQAAEAQASLDAQKEQMENANKEKKKDRILVEDIQDIMSSRNRNVILLCQFIGGHRGGSTLYF